MITTSELAGFVAAHAIWCVSEADALTPMLALTAPDEQRTMTRLVYDEAAAAIAAGREQLATNPANATDAVLVYAGRVDGPGGKIDAVILEMRCYAFPGAEATIAVPYTPTSSGTFRVHQPVLARWQACDDFDVDTAFQAFFHGVGAHEKGAAVWNAALDETR